MTFSYSFHIRLAWKSQPCKANLLGKKLLLINFPSLGGEQACCVLAVAGGANSKGLRSPAPCELFMIAKKYKSLNFGISLPRYFYDYDSMIFCVYRYAFVIT